MTHDEFKERLCEFGLEESLVIDGFDVDKAVVGVSHDERLIYDYELLVEALMEEGLEREDAEDYISYNIIGSIEGGGEKYPIIMHRLDIE